MFNVKRGEIYFVDLGFVEGPKIGKVRPCLIVQNNIGNFHSPTTIVVPITHRTKNISQPTQVLIESHMLEGEGSVNGVIMGEHIIPISKTRIKSFSGEHLVSTAMQLADNSIKTLVGL